MNEIQNTDQPRMSDKDFVGAAASAFGGFVGACAGMSHGIAVSMPRGVEEGLVAGFLAGAVVTAGQAIMLNSLGEKSSIKSNLISAAIGTVATITLLASDPKIQTLSKSQSNISTLIKTPRASVNRTSAVVKLIVPERHMRYSSYKLQTPPYSSPMPIGG